MPSATGLQSETVGISLHRLVVSKPGFAVLPNSRSPTARLTWMLCVERVCALVVQKIFLSLIIDRPVGQNSA